MKGGMIEEFFNRYLAMLQEGIINSEHHSFDIMISLFEIIFCF
jgi:spore maturation protein SpmA